MISAIALITPLLVPMAAPSAQQAAPDPLRVAAADKGTEARATTEDIEVMRRVLVKELTQRPEGSVRVGSELSTPTVLGLYAHKADLLSGGTSVSHSRGFHVPGDGVFYAFDIEVPVRAVPEAKVDEAFTDDAGDAWNDARDELHGKGTNAQGWFDTFGAVRKPVVTELDPERIAEVRETVLRTLARHGARMRGLAPTDNLTVAIHFSAGFVMPNLLSTDGEVEVDGLMSYPFVGMRRAQNQYLVIRLSMKDLAGFIDDRQNARKSGIVHQY